MLEIKIDVINGEVRDNREELTPPFRNSSTICVLCAARKTESITSILKTLKKKEKPQNMMLGRQPKYAHTHTHTYTGRQTQTPHADLHQYATCKCF